MIVVWIKHLHVLLAWLTVAGFAVRGYWSISQNPLRHRRWVRTLPHIVDTLLLAAGIALAISWHISPLAAPWLGAKVIALLVYIGLGMLTLRSRNPLTKRVGLAASLLTAGYIIAVAYTKSPLILPAIW